MIDYITKLERVIVEQDIITIYYSYGHYLVGSSFESKKAYAKINPLFYSQSTAIEIIQLFDEATVLQQDYICYVLFENNYINKMILAAKFLELAQEGIELANLLEPNVVEFRAST